jgi:glycosyltransferase involved in cell wall biosynthesis
VDDFALWPGLDHAPLRLLEERLVRKADVLIAVGEALRDGLAWSRKPVHLLTHGIDLDHWAPRAVAPPLPCLEGLERPLVVFWGVVDRRLDVDFLARLSSDLTRGTIVLAGPESDPDPALAGLARVVRLGPLPFDDLPRLAREAAVLIMPYADLPVTRAIQPLKLKEYLATGRPTVVRDLPANRSWSDGLDLARTPEDFSAAVRLRLETGLPGGHEAARSRLADEGWAAKARDLERWIARDEPDRDDARAMAVADVRGVE